MRTTRILESNEYHDARVSRGRFAWESLYEHATWLITECLYLQVVFFFFCCSILSVSFNALFPVNLIFFWRVLTVSPSGAHMYFQSTLKRLNRLLHSEHNNLELDCFSVRFASFFFIFQLYYSCLTGSDSIFDIAFLCIYRNQTNEWCYNLFNCPLSIELFVKVTFASNLPSPKGS